MKSWALLLPMLILGAVACDDNPVAPTRISNITWKLESIERAGSPAISIPNPERYTLRLEDNGQASVRADCNTCNGRYALDGSSISISAVACTRAFCSLASFDGNYTAALDSIRAVAVSGSTLTMSGPGLSLRFRS